LEYIEQQLAEVERKIDELMKQSSELSAARELLMSVPQGDGQRPAYSLARNKAVAALAGLAPMTNQKRQTTADSRWPAGCAERVVSCRQRASSKRFYQRLMERVKVALVAAMHKLVCILNAMLKRRNPDLCPNNP